MTKMFWPLALTLAGLAATLSIPWLPWRAAFPVIPLLLLGLWWRRRADRRRWGYFLAYALFWMISSVCVAAARHPNPPLAAALMTAAWLVALPRVWQGVRTMRATGFAPALGIAAGAGLLAGLHFMLAEFRRGGAALQWTPIAMLAGGGASAYFAAVAPDESAAERWRWIPLGGLGAAALALLALVGLWGGASLKAGAGETTGRLAQARYWAQIESAVAQSLDIRWARIAAGHRQARLALRAGDRAVWRTTLQRTLAAEPRDAKAAAALLQDSLTARHDRDALFYFRLLADAAAPPDVAQRLLLPAARCADGEALVRAWRLALRQAPADGSAADWALLGKRLYYAGEKEGARQALRKGALTDALDWPALRIYACIAGDAEEYRGLERRLRAITDGPNAGEAAYLRAILAQRAGRNQLERSCLYQTLRLQPEHLGAQRRLAALDASEAHVSAATRAGIEVEGVLRLIECRVSTGELRAGDTLAVRFVWEALAPVIPEWRVFLHLRQERYQGAMIQGDHRFGDVGRAPEEWAIGVPFRYETAVRLPAAVAPGRYSLLVGIWDGHRNRSAKRVGSRPGSLQLLDGNRICVQRGILIRAKSQSAAESPAPPPANG
jgi:hypothetical protein